MAGRVLAVAGIGLVTLAAPTWAQDTTVARTERWRFLSPSTNVSDDPRRTPVPPGSSGPIGTLVLRGGRVFDGTGAPAHEATVVIVRNRIDRILQPSATGWPADAHVIDVS